MGEESKVEARKKKGKKKFKHKKLVAVLVVIVILVVVLYACGQRQAAAAYIQESAALRDIRTYHSFSGTVAPVTEKNVFAEIAGVKVQEVLVEEGDSVKEGDPIAYLDRESIEDAIESLETQMAATASMQDLSVSQAWTAYSNYKSDLENGLNAQLVSAKLSMDNAQQQYETAQRTYLEAEETTANTKQDNITSLQTAVDQAYQAVIQGQLSLETADHNWKEAVSDEAKYQAEMNYEAAEHSLESAWLSYNQAVANLQAAQREDNSALHSYRDQMLSAQTSYLGAIDNYHVTERSVQEALDNYRMQYQQALAQSDTSVNDLQLERYYEQLEDCVVTAPMDGVVTRLSIKEGDLTMSGQVVAVVTSFEEMKIAIRINEYDILGASVGVPVEITLNAINKDYEGEISQISRVASTSGGVSYFNSEVTFLADDDVRSGMSVEVRIIINDLHDVVTVPSRAISTRDDGTAYVTVLLEDGKTQEQRDVGCGVTDGTYVQITEGLSAGETVVYLPETLQELQMRMMQE